MIIKLLEIVLYCNIDLGYILKSIIVLTFYQKKVIVLTPFFSSQ